MEKNYSILCVDDEENILHTLQRLLRKGWVTAEWVAAGPRRRAHVYQLTAAGRKQFAGEASQFTRVMQTIVRLIQPA